MLNEFAYCPRLFYLEWVHGEWEDSADTEEGRQRHRRVDEPRGEVPAAGEGAESAEGAGAIHARSVHLSAPEVGIVARIDLLEGEGREVTPVDYKRGAVPDVPGGAYEPERVQLAAQALVLRENGFAVEEGILWYAASNRRVVVPIDETLVARTIELRDEARRLAATALPPPPLVDSPKCPRCSLVGICLPDEVHALGAAAPSAESAGDDRPPGASGDGEEQPPAIRSLFPARDDRLPLYVQEQGARVGKSGELLAVQRREAPDVKVRIRDTSQVALFGNVQVTTQAIHELCRAEIPVCYFSHGAWFYGMTTGLPHKNVDLRRRQYAVASDADASLDLARRIVRVKIQNCRTILRRNLEEPPPDLLAALEDLAHETNRVMTSDALLGVEGLAARLYFGAFPHLVHPPNDADSLAFDFQSRNRRPPRDPVNALLSLAYALLAKEATVTLAAVGLDPYLGFYHRPRYGRPSLALDLMEEFRPILCDSAVLSAINTGEISRTDFVVRAGACSLTPPGRKNFIQCYERRMDGLVQHPVFGYRISYRRVLEVQARLLGRWLLGEIPDYPDFRTR
ncbi:MAG: CRISPR-associated endonuclease Cas1 [Planctomycetes bacterium]|nr:CRISPR-associated endonuclease Cas1 [Planctomycetota bacterium]